MYAKTRELRLWLGVPYIVQQIMPAQALAAAINELMRTACSGKSADIKQQVTNALPSSSTTVPRADRCADASLAT